MNIAVSIAEPRLTDIKITDDQITAFLIDGRLSVHRRHRTSPNGQGEATKASWMKRLVETVPSPSIHGLVR